MPQLGSKPKLSIHNAHFYLESKCASKLWPVFLSVEAAVDAKPEPPPLVEVEVLDAGIGELVEVESVVVFEELIEVVLVTSPPLLPSICKALTHLFMFN